PRKDDAPLCICRRDRHGGIIPPDICAHKCARPLHSVSETLRRLVGNEDGGSDVQRGTCNKQGGRDSMSILAAVTLVTLLGAGSPAPTEAPKLPVSLRGHLASVTLAKVSRKVGAEASAACPGAKEALELVFFIAPLGDGVDPALSRDVSLDVE